MTPALSTYKSYRGLPPLAGLSEFETCVGYGAHTHYFEPGQLLVAAIVDHLIADPGPATAAD